MNTIYTEVEHTHTKLHLELPSESVLLYMATLSRLEGYSPWGQKEPDTNEVT